MSQQLLPKPVQRCQSLLIKNLEKIALHTFQYYQDLQEDYRKFLPLIIKWVGGDGKKRFG